MKVLRVENDKKLGAGHFTIWVWARDDPLHWKERPYGFKYDNGQVYFIVSGRVASRLVGEALSKDDAIKKAAVYLDGWLRECGAID